jgi:hypothetical protein
MAIDRQINCINDLSAEQAYTVGTAVGSLLQQGMPIDDAVAATRTVAEFIRKGMAAQRAVDEILAAARAVKKSLP